MEIFLVPVLGKPLTSKSMESGHVSFTASPHSQRYHLKDKHVFLSNRYQGLTRFYLETLCRV